MDPLEIKGILFSHETYIIEKLNKASIKLNKEASRKLNKEVLFLNLVLLCEHI